MDPSLVRAAWRRHLWNHGIRDTHPGSAGLQPPVGLMKRASLQAMTAGPRETADAADDPKQKNQRGERCRKRELFCSVHPNSVSIAMAR